jgi:hypothetical protein
MNTARPSSNPHHEAYLKKIAHKWKVWITPASRVGGELPLPIPFRTGSQAREYARACRMKGQRTRITPPDKANKIVDNLLEADVPPEDQPSEDLMNRYAEVVKASPDMQAVPRFKAAVRRYIKWAHSDPDIGQIDYDPADLLALRRAKTFAEVEAILAKYDSPDVSFLRMISQGYFV